MVTHIDILIYPEDAQNDYLHRLNIADILSVPVTSITGIKLIRQSIDARAKRVKFQQRYEVWIDEIPTPQIQFEPIFKNVNTAKEVHIIGAGPTGLFAAIECIANGLKPVVIERGKDVKNRRRDLAAITKSHLVNPESNYCFGEGGAGTYSDGKLYTRSDKRGDVRKVLETFCFFGATEDILINARPHIGTNRLPGIIENMRNFILSAGGEIHFNSKLDDIIIQGDQLVSISINGNMISTSQLVLATGHSARDIFSLLHHREIEIEAKPFAMGVRAEHPQQLIDQVQYHCDVRSDLLPPSYYSMVTQVNQRGMYSFCMCPGGIIAPCATSPGEIVTNGWSPSKRNNPFANSGIVIEITLDDIARITKRNDPLMALDFQQSVEQRACIGGIDSQTAPAQRLVDFTNRKVSAGLPACSYKPGVESVELGDILPDFVSERLRSGFKEFGKKMKGYYTNEAILVAPETRTSSPVRIPRNNDTHQHVRVVGLYPCGEGAGYAGGIVSAAVDGIKTISKSIR